MSIGKAKQHFILTILTFFKKLKLKLKKAGAYQIYKNDESKNLHTVIYHTKDAHLQKKVYNLVNLFHSFKKTGQFW